MKSNVLVRMIYKLLLCIIGIAVISQDGYCQFYDTFSIPANSGSEKTSKILRKGFSYTVTVRGTVSIWSSCIANDTSPCGLDAMYIWNVPSIEIDSSRWPAREYKIDTNIYEGMRLPKWVGDERVYPDSAVLANNPSLRVQLSQDIGLRINNSPLELQNYNNNHVYSFKKIGDGSPLKCKFIDSTSFFLTSNNKIGRHNDNSGEFVIEIAETPLDSFEIKICEDASIDTTRDGKLLGIKLSAKLFKVDSASNDFVPFKNKEMAIFENGNFICPDSTVCKEKTDSSAIVMLFDRSESMIGIVSQSDPTQKIDAAEKSANQFIDDLKAVDKISLYSFGDNVTRDVPWTTDKKSIKDAINAMSKRFGQKTPLYKALDEALDYLSKESVARKAIVCLTDGVNNMDPTSVDFLLNRLKNSNGVPPIYIIALGLDRTNDEVRKAIDTLDLIATASGGRKYESYDSKSLSDIYKLINDKMKFETCCTIYYTVPECIEGKGDTKRDVVIYYNNNGKISATTTSYKTKCSTFLLKNQTMNEELQKDIPPIRIR